MPAPPVTVSAPVLVPVLAVVETMLIGLETVPPENDPPPPPALAIAGPVISSQYALTPSLVYL